MLFDDYDWPAFELSSLRHPKPGIDAFLAVLADEIEIIYKDSQVLIKKTSPPVIDYPVVAEGTIPIMMVVTNDTVAKVASIIDSIVSHSASPSRLHFVLIDCGGGAEGLKGFSSAATWVSGAGACYANNMHTETALLHVYDLCPTMYSSYIFVSSASRLITGDIVSMWLHAPSVASVAAFSGNDDFSEFSMEVAVVNRVRFNSQAKVAALMMELGAFGNNSPWTPLHFVVSEMPQRTQNILFPLENP